MADNGIRSRHFCLPDRIDAHTIVLINVLPALQ